MDVLASTWPHALPVRAMPMSTYPARNPSSIVDWSVADYDGLAESP